MAVMWYVSPGHRTTVHHISRVCCIISSLYCTIGTLAVKGRWLTAFKLGKFEMNHRLVFDPVVPKSFMVLQSSF